MPAHLDPARSLRRVAGARPRPRRAGVFLQAGTAALLALSVAGCGAERASTVEEPDGVASLAAQSTQDEGVAEDAQLEAERAAQEQEAEAAAAAQVAAEKQAAEQAAAKQAAAEQAAAEQAAAEQAAAEQAAAEQAAAEQAAAEQAAAADPAPAAGYQDGPYKNCDAVRAAGAAPITADNPWFERKFDRDGDGVGCEN